MDVDVAGRGVKRRRNTNDDTDLLIRRKLHHELKEVQKTARKARTFEVRKIIKRLKSLRSKEPNTSEMEDLEAQLLVLKRLGIEIVGNTTFRTKVYKRKSLISNESVKAAIEEEIGSNILPLPEPGTSAYKAQSKLLSSKSLAEQVASAVQAIENLVVPQGQGEQVERPSGVQAESLNAMRRKCKAKDEKNTPNAQSGSVSADDGWESGSLVEEMGDISEDADSKSSSNREDIHANHESNTATRISRTQSAFLPSLAVGFVRGDSDDSNFEDEAEPGRKNRRGQRARRAIWEKKYGKNANHKKKVVERQIPGLRKLNVENTAELGLQSNQRQHIRQQDIKPDAERNKGHFDSWTPRIQEPLHPSWEAKKRLKEQMKPNIVPSQGKKIVF